MVQVSYPGVYIQEVPSGVHTITGVSTSITAFFGRAGKGPINKAVRILSRSDFVRNFGGPFPKCDLADNVRLFFDNGGTDAYVIRLASGAEKAHVALKSLEDEAVLLARAKAEGEWGDTVRLEVDYNTHNPDETFNLSIIHEVAGQAAATEQHLNLSMDPNSPRFAPAFVTQSSDLIELKLGADIGPINDTTADIFEIAESFEGFSQARRPLGLAADVKSTLDTLIGAGKTNFDISVNGSQFVTVDLTGISTNILGNIPGVIGDRINNQALSLLSPTQLVSCDWVNRGDVHNLLTITSASGDFSSVRVCRSPSNDISAALMLGIDQGGIEVTRYSNFRPAPSASFLKSDAVAAATAAAITTTINSIANLDQTELTQITVDSQLIPLDAGDYNLETVPFPPAPALQKWFVSAAIPNSPHGDNDGVREKLRIMARAINAEARTNPDLNVEAEVWGYHLAIKPSNGTLNTISAAATDQGSFNTGLVANTKQYSLGLASSSAFVDDQHSGSDGSAPGASDYVGDPVAQTGFHALDPVDLFNIMVIAGDEEVLQPELNLIWGPASTYCQQHRAFLLIDPPDDWTDTNGRPEVVQDTSKINSLRSMVVNNHSAVFYPRLRYASDGLVKTIGPSGAIAGLFSRIDATRGVWKAAAGLEADLRNILGLKVNLTDMENGVLNKQGANCLRIFAAGIVSWGARTLDGADDLTSEWKYIPIRRLALFLEESLFRGTKWVVFEPNDEPLWAKVRLNINAFMMGLFRQGAFQGTTPSQAFYVKCDAETTTPTDQNLGIVNIEVGFAPLKPAEFVVIKIQQIAEEL